MIITLFLNAVYAIVYGITAVFRITPNVELPQIITGSIENASNYVSAIDDIAPVHEIFFIFLFVFVTFEIAKFSYNLVMWVVKKIPTIS